MTRRNDYRTAELVDLVLLTRDAFGETGAFAYMSMAGIDPAYFARFLEAIPQALASGGSVVTQQILMSAGVCRGRNSSLRRRRVSRASIDLKYERMSLI